MNYRSDIDGLRAVAVGVVVLYHAGLPGLSGGFVGVDVFFVISGFLITRILIDEFEAGTYSIAGFYERRARRLFPALAVVIAATSIASVAILLPDDLAEYGSSVAAAALFVSNIFFWIETGDYFAGPAELKPLLHTWSLAVEEQFYIVFPLVLAALFRIGLKRFLPLFFVVGFGVSLGLSVWATDNASEANFYLLITRAWELLAGSILALRVLPTPSRAVAEIEAALGLLLIMGSAVLYRAGMPFPGLSAVPPVLGAALILHAGSAAVPTAVGRLLGFQPIRFVGLVSYSFYLWHWPVFALVRYREIDPSPATMAAATVVAFVLAVVSWRYVERPFRHRDGVFRRGPLLAVTAVSIALIAAVGLLLDRSQGLPGRMPPDLVALAQKKTHQGPGRECGNAHADGRSAETLCRRGAQTAEPDFVLVGDSHANAIAATLFDAAARAGRSGIQLTDNGYRPVLGFVKKGEEAKYAYMNDLLVGLLASKPEIREVVVAIYWKQAALQTEYREGGDVVDGLTGLERGLANLIDAYPDHHFLLLTSPPNAKVFGGAPMARAIWAGRDLQPSISTAEFRSEAAHYADLVARLDSRPNVDVFDLSTRICDDTVCTGGTAADLLYSDDNHLSHKGANLYLDDLAGRMAAGRPEAAIAGGASQ